MVFLGVFPKPFLDRVTPSVDHLLAHVQTVDPSFHIPSQGRTTITYTVPANQNVDTGIHARSGLSSAAGQGGKP
jgi:hypothetical protein